MNLVPIKVKIGTRADGHKDHPQWSLLDSALGGPAKEHAFFGWHYDSTDGPSTDSPGSPIGFHFGVRFVTPELAAAALVQ